ncbi:MAG: hypothetical protein IMZ43_11140 [Thermoplasmata archaeon]|nr:hypothetical protein [Thermoplasmata archaeon]MBE3137926.1 hypothetical protein [Thermoplasmata archaeon]MBE3141616.1 hypothetical protein [Thermoplasmata archaeon]
MNMSRWVDLESSAKMLLLSNLLTIVIAILFHWSILTLLWGYWLQSIIIGLFTVVKLLVFGYRNKHQRLLLTAVRDSIFFSVHYGIFHFVYLIFLYFFSTSGISGFHFRQPDYIGITFIGVLFFVNHLYSFLKNYVLEKKRIGKSTNQIFLEPYKRIFPMHLIIIAAGFFSAMVPSAEIPLIIVFLLLKTLADLKSHEILHQSDTRPSFRQ